jgi:hypothetical protein
MQIITFHPKSPNKKDWTIFRKERTMDGRPAINRQIPLEKEGRA